MKAKIYITLKKAVLDPQGKAVIGALETMGYNEIRDLRIGKYMEMEIASPSKKETEEIVKGICEKLLANTVIEDYRFEIE